MNNIDTQYMRIAEPVSLLDSMRDHNSALDSEIIIRDENNNILHHTMNMTVFAGRLHLLESSFGIVPDVTKHLLLNTIMGIPHAESANVISNNVRRSVGYFMIGNGAASPSVSGKIYNPHNYETKLYTSVPFRCVPTSSDLSTLEAANYRLRKVITIDGSDYYAYYAKKFTVGTVVTEYNGASYVPMESHTIPVDEGDTTHELGGGSVLSYVQFTLTVDQDEFKEYYRLTHNDTLDGAVLNEIGLVLGSDLANASDSDRNELAAAELFAKLTSTSVPLDKESSRRVIEYRIYS